jgi:hypothetical protein
MAATIALTIQSEDTEANLAENLQIEAAKNRLAALNVEKVIRGLRSGMIRGRLDVQLSGAAPVAASGTITLASFANDDTVVIGGVTLTGKSSPTTENHFEIDGNDTADAAALAACINAHSTLSKVLTATSAAAVVTLTCRVKGVVGNFIIMSQTGNHATLAQLASGAGGAQDDAVQYVFGI